MKSRIATVIAPLLSIGILMLGNGLFGTVLPLRLNSMGIHSFYIGLTSSAYYVGLVIGALWVASFVLKVGHIRAYAAFASFLSVVTLIHGFFVEEIYLGVLLRILGGICLTGLFIVVESWLLNSSTVKTRGVYLALYMIALYGFQSLGQFFLNLVDYKTLIPFCITTILTSLSVLPLTMTTTSYPQIEEPSALSLRKLYSLAPSGVVGCTASGLIMGSIYGLLPLFVERRGYGISNVALVMFACIFGGMLLQYPTGRLSDIVERRKVLLGLNIASLFISVILAFWTNLPIAGLIGFIFIFGGITFTLYPISISHACDSLDPKDFLSATQGLLLAYSIGAVAGPVISPYFMELIGPSGLFIYFALISACLAGFFWYRLRTVCVVPTPDHATFVFSPQTTTIVGELDPRAILNQASDSNANFSKVDEKE